MANIKQLKQLPPGTVQRLLSINYRAIVTQISLCNYVFNRIAMGVKVVKTPLDEGYVSLENGIHQVCISESIKISNLREVLLHELAHCVQGAGLHNSIHSEVIDLVKERYNDFYTQDISKGL